MTFSFEFGNQQYNIQADQVNETNGGLILRDAQVQISMPLPVQSYYRHGWQSWSLTAWLDADFALPVQKPDLMHPLQTDPLYAKHPAPNGSWLGAAQFEDGNILLLGALEPDAHVALHSQQLHGWYEDGKGEWFVGYGEEASVFAQYAELLGNRLGRAPGKSTPRVWCSWYSLYTAIEEPLLYRIFDELGDLPFDVLQVDDGWQVAIGDWEANQKFPSGMETLAEKIKSTGRKAGLWLAPLIAVRSSRLFREHPGWFLKDVDGRFVSAGFSWGDQLYALDCTHPEVLEWVSALMNQVRAWGFDYLKLDFLYAGALPGKRYMDMPREAAYRQALKMIRESMGLDAYFLACGAPIVPSIGLCDALRIGPDVAGKWESYRNAVLLYNPTTPGTKNAIRTTVNRLWLSPLVATDPDVAYFRSRYFSMKAGQKQMLQDLATVCKFKATSDLPQWLSDEESARLRAFLESESAIERTGRFTYLLDGRQVDFSPATLLPEPPQGLKLLASEFLGWVGNWEWAMKLLDWLGKMKLKYKFRHI